MAVTWVIGLWDMQLHEGAWVSMSQVVSGLRENDSVRCYKCDFKRQPAKSASALLLPKDGGGSQRG